MINKKHGKEYELCYVHVFCWYLCQEQAFLFQTWLSAWNLILPKFKVLNSIYFKAGMGLCLWQAMCCSYCSFIYRQRCVTSLCWSVWQNLPFKLQLMCLGRWLILSIYHQTASSLFKNMPKNVDTDLGTHNKPWCNANLNCPHVFHH